MNAAASPLLELYTVLHTFCVGLQLDVLYCQTMQLIRSTLTNECQVEEYVPGKRLHIAYWRRALHDSLKTTLSQSQVLKYICIMKRNCQLTDNPNWFVYFN